MVVEIKSKVFCMIKHILCHRPTLLEGEICPCGRLLRIIIEMNNFEKLVDLEGKEEWAGRQKVDKAKPASGISLRQGMWYRGKINALK